MPRHSNFYDDDDLDDDYEYDEDENIESDDPVHQLADFITHGIDAESSTYILSIFPLIKKPEGEPFLVDVLERCDGDFEACVNEIYEMAQKEEERKKKSAANIVVKSNASKATGNKNNNSNKANKTTQQQPAVTTPSTQQNNSQKKNDNKKQANKKKDTKSNIILVSELDNFTEISGTPTPTSEVSENIFTGMLISFILIMRIN